MRGEALRNQYMRDLADISEVLPSVWEERAWSERCLEVSGERREGCSDEAEYEPQ